MKDVLATYESTSKLPAGGWKADGVSGPDWKAFVKRLAADARSRGLVVPDPTKYAHDRLVARLLVDAPSQVTQTISYWPLARQAATLGGSYTVVDKSALHPCQYFYNPGLCRHQGQLLFCYRRQQANGKSDLGICVLDEVTLQPVKKTSELIRVPKRFEEYEHLEDPRIFEHAGRLYVSYCSWRGAGKGPTWQYMPSQVCARLAPAKRGGLPSVAEQLLTPAHGRNGVDPQKNWTWFSGPEGLGFVYRVHPHEMVIGDAPRAPVVWPLAWPYSELRGGTPPVLIGDEFWSFFHAHVPGTQRTRRYLFGAYVFESLPPYRPLRYTPDPLFAASENDPGLHWAPLVVFPCGAVFENGEWLISCGVHDWYSAILRVPHEAIEARMRRVEY